MPKKKLVVFCDGTWNSADNPDRTNVFRLYQATEARDAIGQPQVVHYVSGVGTGRGIVDKVTGGGFGMGISDNIKNAYRFIVSNYQPNDEIFLFGFSRGAYTARSIAGLIRNMGILRRENLYLAGEVYKRYKDRSTEWSPNGVQAVSFRERNNHPGIPPIRFLGVWDTVGALGAPFGTPFGLLITALSKTRFHDMRLSTYVESAYHALAIDERRWPFRPTRWELDPIHDQRNAAYTQQKGIPLYEEQWFPGVHSNVGGGYPNVGLSDCALSWMANRAQHHGLNLNTASINPGFAPNPLDHINDSQTPMYRRLTRLFVLWASRISPKLVYPAGDRPLVQNIQPNGDYRRPVNTADVSQCARQRLNHAAANYRPPNVQPPLLHPPRPGI